MSHIPSSAMRRAAPADVLEQDDAAQGTAHDTAHSQDKVDLPSRSIFDWARDNRALVIGAGALAAGAAAYAYKPGWFGAGEEAPKKGKKRRKKD